MVKRMGDERAWADGRGWGWEKDDAYGDVFFRRATGALPEMESSKAASGILRDWVVNGSRILDVGCGGGHYLRSFRARIPTAFHYMGVDITPRYVGLARSAHASDPDASFQVADIHELPFEDASFDIVTCNNVLLHLPAIKRPLEELCRVSRRHVLVRTLVGERSFRIQEVRGTGDEFMDDGVPREFNHYNIYSAPYVRRVLKGIGRVQAIEIAEDRDFDPVRIQAAAAEQPLAANVTTMHAGWQVNGYVLQPWAFVKVTLAEGQ